MVQQARVAMGVEELTVIADRGYFKGEEISACAQQGITTLMPKPMTSSHRAAGRFDKHHFIYITSADEYRCAAGQRAIRRLATVEKGKTIYMRTERKEIPRNVMPCRHTTNLNII
jgi:hypothetical protein